MVNVEGGFRSRPGQRLMAEKVAETFAAAQLGKLEEDEEPQRSIAVIQAGTGVGKSLAYALPAIAMALERGTRVLISTATVALQEQLVSKDLPVLAQQMDQPFKYALAKGRGRYVCKLKLERLASVAQGDGADGAEPIDDDFFPEEAAQARQAQRSPQENAARLQFYTSMADALATRGCAAPRPSTAW